MFKKILSFILGVFVFVWGFSLAQGINFYYDSDNKDSTLITEPTTDIAKELTKTAVVNEDSLLNRLTGLFFPSYEYTGSYRAIHYIKWIVNIALSFVSLIALILVIYGFYLMFFAKDEEGFGKAKKMLKWVTIALVIMWLSWIIVTFLFETQKTLTGW